MRLGIAAGFRDLAVSLPDGFPDILVFLGHSYHFDLNDIDDYVLLV